jgi:hypothetical protein
MKSFKKSPQKHFKIYSNNSREKSLAQATVETMIMIAIGIFILAVFASTALQQAQSYSLLQQKKIGETALNEIAKQVNEAYFSGAGTVKKITVILPEHADLSNSSISGNSLSLRIGSNDIIATTIPEIKGTWPGSTGSYTLTITAFEDFVLISSTRLVFNPTKLIISVPQNQSINSEFSVSNFSTTQKTLTLHITNSYSDINLTSTKNEVDQNLAVGASVTFDLTASCSFNSIGEKNISLSFTGDENTYYSVKVICAASSGRMVVYATDSNSSTNATCFKQFKICNNTPNALTNLSAVASGGFSSAYFFTLPSTVPANDCVDANIKIRSGALASFSGNISITSNGLSASSANTTHYNNLTDTNVSKDYNSFSIIPNSSFSNQTTNLTTGLYLNGMESSFEIPDSNCYLKNDCNYPAGQISAGNYFWDANLLYYWRFNDKNGSGYVKNEVTGDYDVKLYGDANTNKAKCLFDTNCLSLDIVNAASITSAESLTKVLDTNYFTISFWVYFKSLPASSHQILNLGASTGGLFFNQYAGILYIYYASAGGPQMGYQSLYTNRWMHIVQTKSGTTFYTYVDKKIAGPYTIATNINNTTKFYFGNAQAYGSNSLKIDGYIEEVMYWNRALTATEVRNLYDVQNNFWLNDRNLLVYQKLNDNQMLTSFDSSRNSATGLTAGYVAGYTGGSYTSGVPTYPGINDSSSLYFDGTDDRVSLGTGTIADTNFFTLSAWIKPNYTTGVQRYAICGSDGSSPYKGWTLGITATNGYITVYDTNGGGFVNSTYQAPNYRWSFIAVRGFKDAVNGFIDASLNGQTWRTIRTGNTLAWEMNGDNPLQIGRWGGANHYFNGQIDEVKVWDKNLSQAEITAEFMKGVNTYVTTPITTINNILGIKSLSVNNFLDYNFGKQLTPSTKTYYGGILRPSDALYDQNLVALWHLNAGGTDTNSIIDEVGLGEGKCQSASACSLVEGKFGGNSIQINDGNGIYFAGNPNLPQSNNSRTISIWFKPAIDINILDSQSIFSYGGTTARTNFAIQLKTGFISVDTNNYNATGSDYVSFKTNFLADFNSWNHVVVTYDKNSYNLKVYKNGQLIGTQSRLALVSSSSAPNTTGFSGYFGTPSDVTQNSKYFKGVIAETAVWNRVLTDAEINWLYFHQKNSLKEGLVGLWNMNDGNTSANSLVNSVGNGMDGNCLLATCPTKSVGLWDTNSFDFDTNLKYFQFDPSNLVYGWGNRTFSAWVYPTAVQTYPQTLFLYGGGGNANYFGIFFGNVSNTPNVTFGAHLNNCALTFGTIVQVQHYTWNHIAVVVDRNIFYGYLNGTLVGSASIGSCNFNTIYSGNSSGRIGKAIWGGWTGKLEDIAFWNRGLSARDVWELYRAGVSRLDLNVMDCSNASCSTQSNSQYYTGINNGEQISVTHTSTQTIGVKAIFTIPNGFDGNYERHFIGAMLQDMNYTYAGCG